MTRGLHVSGLVPLAVALVGAMSPVRADEDILSRLAEDAAYLVEDARLVIDATGWAFFDDPRETDDVFQAQGSARYEVTGRVLDDWEVALIPVLQLHSEDIVEKDFRVSERGERRPLLGLAEAWVSRYEGPFTMTVGKQIFAWGSADLINPTDDLNASDKLDLPFAFKLGAPSVKLSYASLDVGIELAAIPFFTPDRLPEEGNSWSRGSEAVADGFQQQFGFRPDVVRGDRRLPTGSDQFQFGARVTSSTLLQGWDLAASAFHGIARTPIFLPELVAPQTLALTELFPRYTEFGVGFSTIVEEVTLNGEVSWHLTRNEDQDDDYLSYVIGFRRDWSDLDLEDISRIQLTLEYSGETITRQVDDATPFLRSAFDRSFDNSVLGKLEVELDSDTTVTAAGAFNIDERDWALDAFVERDIGDRLTLTFGGQIFTGPSDSFFGAWRENDRIYLKAKLSL